MSWKALLLTLVAGSCLAACGSTPDNPYVAPVREPEPIRKVDPVVDQWFRAVKPVDATTILPGDVVKIQVHGLPEYGVTREVPPNGNIPLPRGRWSVSSTGLTAQELEVEIARVYSAKLIEPYVVVTVDRRAPRNIYVAGAVGNPQRIPVDGSENLDLLKVLTLAGGPLETADLYGVTIMRRYPSTGETVSSAPLDLQSVIELGDQTDNLAVLPGDQIVVPESKSRQVHIMGHVKNPGPMAWYKGLTLSGAVTERGGFERFAKKESISIVRRDGSRILYDFNQLIDGNAQDLELRPGDVIFIDEKWI